MPQEKVAWDVEWPEYRPVEYTAPHVLLAGPSCGGKWFKWADDIHFSKPSITSLVGKVKLDAGFPRNPVGRTGLVGRGTLGKWGERSFAWQLYCRTLGV